MASLPLFLPASSPAKLAVNNPKQKFDFQLRNLQLGTSSLSAPVVITCLLYCIYIAMIRSVYKTLLSCVSPPLYLPTFFTFEFSLHYLSSYNKLLLIRQLWTYSFLCEIWVFYSGAAEVPSLPRCDAVSLDKELQNFERIIMFSSSGSSSLRNMIFNHRFLHVFLLLWNDN